MRNCFGFLLVLCLCLPACQSRPDYVIEEQAMTDLLTDVHMAEALIDLQQKQTREDHEYGQQVIAAVLEKHHVTKVDYDTSLVWYSQHLSSLVRIYKQVNRNLAEREESWTLLAESANEFGVSEAGDSINVWRTSPYLVMDEHRASHARYWTIATDSNYLAGDTIRWMMHVPQLPVGEGLIASLTLLERDGKMSGLKVKGGVTTSWLTQDSLLTLTCVPDSASAFTQIVASLHLMKSDSLSTPLRPCVVDQLQMIRLHVKK